MQDIFYATRISTTRSAWTESCLSSSKTIGRGGDPLLRNQHGQNTMALARHRKSPCAACSYHLLTVALDIRLIVYCFGKTCNRLKEWNENSCVAQSLNWGCVGENLSPCSCLRAPKCLRFRSRFCCSTTSFQRVFNLSSLVACWAFRCFKEENPVISPSPLCWPLGDETLGDSNSNLRISLAAWAKELHQGSNSTFMQMQSAVGANGQKLDAEA